MDKKEGFIQEANKVIEKYNNNNLKTVMKQLREDLNKVLNNYLAENEMYEKDFPIKFENEFGKFSIESSGHCYFQPKYAIQTIDVNITILPSKTLEKKEIIGKKVFLDLSGSAPVEVVVLDVTPTTVVCEYAGSTPGRTEEFSISDFEKLSGLAIFLL